MARHDVAIYAPFARGLYDHSSGRAGGAERQMTLLARALSTRGHRVAHIIYRPRDPIRLPYPLTLVYRDGYAGNRRIVGGLLEAVRIWRALRTSDARVTIVRTASPAVGVAALFCRLRGRALIFSSANNKDFMPGRTSNRWYGALYKLGVRLGDIVVVQSDDQRVLAERAFPSLRRLVQIPSLADLAPVTSRHDGGPPDEFLWFGRLVDYKQPMRYLELARAVPEARFSMIPILEDGNVLNLEELRAEALDVPNLELRDPIPHDELSELIARSVAVVNSSTLEGMPNSFLEAWARGVPVLTLQFDPDGVVGRYELGIAAGGSWDRFVEGAQKLWAERARRDKQWSRVRAYVEEVHSIEAVGARWSELVREFNRET